MALEFMDSCSHMGSGEISSVPPCPLDRKWTFASGYYCNASSSPSGPVRRSAPSYAATVCAMYCGSGSVFGASAYKTLPYVDARFIGLAFYLPEGSLAGTICQFLSGGAVLASLGTETDGTVSIRNNQNTLIWNSAPYVFAYDAYHYVEFFTSITGTTPVTLSCSLVIDGNTLVTNVTGSAGINASQLLVDAALMNQISIGGTSPCYAMDIIVFNTSTTDVNGNATLIYTFQGDVDIDAVIPDADVTTAWSKFPSGAANQYGLVNEIPPDDDTTYIYSDTVSQVSSFNMTPITGFSGTLVAAQLLIYSKKDAEGSRAIVGQLNSATLANWTGVGLTPVNNQYLFDYYQYFIFPLDSDGGTPWTPTNFNAATFGVEVSV